MSGSVCHVTLLNSISVSELSILLAVSLFSVVCKVYCARGHCSISELAPELEDNDKIFTEFTKAVLVILR